MLSRTIKEQRVMHMLSQKKLAELLGVSQQAVAKWETTRTEPGTLLLKKMAVLFGVSVDYLVGQLERPPTGLRHGKDTFCVKVHLSFRGKDSEIMSRFLCEGNDVALRSFDPQKEECWAVGKVLKAELV